MAVYLSDDSEKELMHAFDVLQTIFQKRKKYVDNRKPYSSNNDSDEYLSPDLYYNFQFGDKKCTIHRMNKTKLYTISCYGFKPRDLDYFSPTKILDNDFYQNAYGCFDTLEDARSAFARISYMFFEPKQMEIF